MQSSHVASAVAAVFDEPNLIADAGLVPVVRLAERAGLVELTEQAVGITGAGNSGGTNPGAKVMSPVAAMCAGADGIEDTGRLRHGAMPVAFDQIRAPPTVGHSEDVSPLTFDVRMMWVTIRLASSTRLVINPTETRMAAQGAGP